MLENIIVASKIRIDKSPEPTLPIRLTKDFKKPKKLPF